jgi:hypothetical protein
MTSEGRTGCKIDSAKTKAAEHCSAAWRDPKNSQNQKLLIALPQCEARALQVFDFEFFFFFFEAMTLFLDV